MSDLRKFGGSRAGAHTARIIRTLYAMHFRPFKQHIRARLQAAGMHSRSPFGRVDGLWLAREIMPAEDGARLWDEFCAAGHVREVQEVGQSGWPIRKYVLASPPRKRGGMTAASPERPALATANGRGNGPA